MSIKIVCIYLTKTLLFANQFFLMQLTINKTTIKILKGDLTEINADAIVNAGNNQGFMGGGVALAIRKKGGEIIEKQAIAKSPYEIGDAIITSAGNLKAKYVIHAGVMGMDFETDETKIRKATLNSLKRAEDLKLKSIAFPSFGTGVGRFPPEKSAKAMLNAVKEHLKKETSLQEVLFVLYNEEIYKKFEEQLKN